MEGDESHHHHGGQRDDDEGGEPQQPQGLEGGGEEAHEAAASLGAYLEAVDRVQEAMRFLRRNARMRSAEVTLRQLELKQQKLLADMREEVYRVLVMRSRCALALAPGAGAGDSGVDYQASDPIPPSAARRVRALVDSLLRAGDARWAEQAYVKARRAKLDGALKPFLERQQQVLFGGKGRDAAAVTASVVLGERDRALPGMVDDALGMTTTTTVGRGSVSARVASTAAGGGPEGEWVRYLQFVRELVKGASSILYPC